ncbi:alpha/beta hydrolase fold protein [Catenulispora acidiphila DSM 44928]|uniref:Alpha/beta hydrolase fold protein n=1 Tax=Catenulispora acidiphila (strain DSM 44928 / JCM 14897 / NBRC 102108 / NRRL B-24433 / ID139908) TaxID=479433 RepID=C7Q4Z4_CATAD|nr:alpha/beta hydrolase [Catenulispora acidiphila]ACU73942.1 alpha/beta hydrolase fold protein [Catenulispora acidiphila DSM 44928]
MTRHNHTLVPEAAAGSTPAFRHKVRFPVGNTYCVAWHYPGTNGACVIMASGAGVTKEPGTDRFARRFHDAGFSIVAFDHRRFGESGGRQRQIVRTREQLADWRAAIGFAATLPDVKPERIAIWSFSMGGGHVIRTAAHDQRVAAAIAQMALADGQAAAPKALRSMTFGALLRVTGKGMLDGLGALLGRRPLLIPATGERGTVAMLTTPDALDGTDALDPHGEHVDTWDQTIAARVVLRAGFYRPIRHASRVQCPLLVVACDQDQTVLPEPGIRASELAPRGELLVVPGTHYAPFLHAHEQAVTTELSFLSRHLLPAAQATA